MHYMYTCMTSLHANSMTYIYDTYTHDNLVIIIKRCGPFEYMILVIHEFGRKFYLCALNIDLKHMACCSI